MTSRRPRSVLDPITIHNSSQSELEYLEIFDFFNYPRLNSIAGSDVFDPSVSVSVTTQNQTSPPSAGGGQGQTQQSFRATPAFVIPNPESDWLIFKPPYE
jgi:hypothetical protein